jgi:hypothetical protein
MPNDETRELGQSVQAAAVTAGASAGTGRLARRAARRPGGRVLAGLAATAVLVITGTTGCSVFQPSSAPAGLQKQIVLGERVGAASRAQAAQAARAARSAAESSLAAQPRVTGREVTAIGDSVMSASAMSLAAVLPGIYIDAKPDREMPAGLAILRSLAASGLLRPIVVVGLGTNYLVTTGQLQELLRIIGPDRKLVLINTYVPDGWSKMVNATEAAFVRRHPSVVLADWYDTIKNRMYLLWPDHVHPIMPGTVVYARMVYRAIQATRNVPGFAPATLPVVASRASAAPKQHAGT